MRITHLIPERSGFSAAYQCSEASCEVRFRFVASAKEPRGRIRVRMRGTRIWRADHTSY
jgi:hypothetical protein